MPGVAERVVARLRVHRPGELQLVAERRMGRSGDNRRVDAHHHGRKAPRILARRLRGLQLLEESHLPVRIDAGRDALQEPCPAVRIDMYEDVHLELPGRGGRRCVRERRNSLHLDVARPKPNRESRFVRRLLVDRHGNPDAHLRSAQVLDLHHGGIGRARLHRRAVDGELLRGERVRRKFDVPEGVLRHVRPRFVAVFVPHLAL